MRKIFDGIDHVIADVPRSAEVEGVVVPITPHTDDSVLEAPSYQFGMHDHTSQQRLEPDTSKASNERNLLIFPTGRSRDQVIFDLHVIRKLGSIQRARAFRKARNSGKEADRLSTMLSQFYDGAEA